MAWNIDDVLNDDLVNVVFRDDCKRVYEVQIGSLKTIIPFQIDATPATN